MGIRDALTDDYLARFYDRGTLARARDCLERVVELEAVHETSSSLTATAEVWGTAPIPYGVQFHAEVNETSRLGVQRVLVPGRAHVQARRGRRPAAARRRTARRRAAVAAAAGAASAGSWRGARGPRWRGRPWGWRSPGGRPPGGRAAPPATSPCVRCDRARAGAGRAAGPSGRDLSGPAASTATCPAQVEALQALQPRAGRACTPTSSPAPPRCWTTTATAWCRPCARPWPPGSRWCPARASPRSR